MAKKGGIILMNEPKILLNLILLDLWKIIHLKIETKRKSLRAKKIFLVIPKSILKVKSLFKTTKFNRKRKIFTLYI